MPDNACKIAGVVLGAGLSTRFNGDKLTAPLAVQPLAFWVLRAAREAGLDSLLLVTRPGLVEFFAARFPDLNIVANLDPALGQASSLALALRHIPQDASHLLFMLADQPLLGSHLLRHFKHLAKSGVGLAALRDHDHAKPPALFGRRYFAELAALSGDTGGRELFKKHAPFLWQVSPLFAGQGADVDSRDDLDRLEGLVLGRMHADSLCQCLGITDHELVCLVGAGGKTSLMNALANEMWQDGRGVILATTTRMFPPPWQMRLEPEPDRLTSFARMHLSASHPPPLALAPALSLSKGMLKVNSLRPELVDSLWHSLPPCTLLVEADGARGLSLKAPREHEPVLAATCGVVVGVLGLSALGLPADGQHVFALSHFCEISDAKPGQIIRPEHLARLILHEQGLFKGAPPQARRVVFLNQSDAAQAELIAELVAEVLNADPSNLVLATGSVRNGVCRRLLSV